MLRAALTPRSAGSPAKANMLPEPAAPVRHAEATDNVLHCAGRRASSGHRLEDRLFEATAAGGFRQPATSMPLSVARKKNT